MVLQFDGSSIKISMQLVQCHALRFMAALFPKQLNVTVQNVTMTLHSRHNVQLMQFIQYLKWFSITLLSKGCYHVPYSVPFPANQPTDWCLQRYLPCVSAIEQVDMTLLYLSGSPSRYIPRFASCRCCSSYVLTSTALVCLACSFALLNSDWINSASPSCLIGPTVPHFWNKSIGI